MISYWANEWLEAKANETVAVEKRRWVEDQLIKDMGLEPSLDGSDKRKDGPYTITVTGRINRKIDADKLQELAAEEGLSDHLSALFRWTPSLNMAAWKAAADNITRPLSAAITSEPGRPSFKIVKDN